MVTSTKPAEGAWSWVSRHRGALPAARSTGRPTTRSRSTSALQGRRTPARASGAWRTARSPSHTGSSMVSTVDVDRAHADGRRNGKVIRVIPVTTGKAGFLTRNGTKVVLEKHTLKVMDASDDRHPQGQPGVLPARRALRDAGDLERRVRARRPVVDRQPGPGQRQPRLRRHEHVQRDLVVQPVARRRHRQGGQLAAARSSPATATPTGTSPGPNWLKGSALRPLQQATSRARRARSCIRVHVAGSRPT